MSSGLWLPASVRRQTDGPSVNQVGVYLPVNEVFPGLEANETTLKNLLPAISRTDALIWCARLNLVVSNPSYENRLAKQRYCVANFFSAEETQKINKFASEHGGPPTVFFRGQLLELMRWISLYCEDLPGDGATFKDAENRRTFAKAALIASDLWGWPTYQDKMHLDEGVHAARRRSLGSIRLAFDGTDEGPDPMMAVGRARSLFMDHLTRVRPSFPEEFRAEIGIGLEDYFALLSIIAVHYLNRTPEDAAASNEKCGLFLLAHLTEKDWRLAPIAKRYFESFSQTADELAIALWPKDTDSSQHSLAWRDFRAIRDRPVLRTRDGRAIVLDQVFFALGASIGPLFLALPNEKAQGDALLVRFGHAFESYASSVLCRM
jgi:hypothetical protein